jgi:hypothetical protein
VQVDFVIAKAARAVLARTLRLTEMHEDSQPLHWPLRVRKRHAVALYGGDLAMELFYSSNGWPNADFLPRVLAPLIVSGDEVDRSKLRRATWRLVVKNYNRILTLALELTRAES